MLYYADPDNQRIYRYEARALRNRDNREIGRVRLEIDEKFNDGLITSADLLNLYNWPVIQFGASRFEVVDVDITTVDQSRLGELDWRSIELTEEVFNNLTEEFTALCFEALMKKNPHRNLEYDWLKKTKELLAQTTQHVSTSSIDTTNLDDSQSGSSSDSSSTEKSSEKTGSLPTTMIGKSTSLT